MAYTSMSWAIIEGSQSENSRQELVQRPWENNAYWLAFHGLLSLFFCITKDHLTKGGTTHSVL